MTETFRNGVGRLTVDRYDFQSHIDGNPPHHKAGIITLDPAVVINSVSHTNIQGAIEELAPFAVTVPDATSSVKGIIQLSGDLFLSTGAGNPICSASYLLYRPLAQTPPSSGNVLTWNGLTWSPAAIPSQFNPGNDLQAGGGDGSTNQEVIGITGISDQVSVKCNTFQFKGNLPDPKIMQEETRNPGATLNIIAQNSASTGGGVSISSGYGHSGIGSIKLQLQPTNSTFSTLLHVASIDGRKVLGLVSDTPITNTEMPSNTGDLVVYLKNTSTPPSPSTGVKPVGGCVLYSSAGRLCVKQPDGETKIVGNNNLTTIDGRKVLGLVSEAPVTSTEMPINTGDLVVYFKNASTIPSVSTGVKPVGGCVLYSSAGKLCVKQSDGEVKVVGTNNLNTPISYFGTYNDSGSAVELHKFTVTSPAGSSQSIYSYVFDEGPNIVMAEIDAVGFTADGAETHSSKRIISFQSISSGGNYFQVLGSESVLHEQEAVLSGAFNSTFYDSYFHTQYTIEFMSGSHSLKETTWSICIKLHFGLYT